MAAPPNAKLERALRQLETSTSWGLLKPGNDVRRAAMIAIGKDWSENMHSVSASNIEPERSTRCALSDSERIAAVSLATFADAAVVFCASLEVRGVR